jgi:hypothetical protein
MTHCACTCDSIAFVRVGDTIYCCRCKQPVSLRPASDLLSVAHRLPEREVEAILDGYAREVTELINSGG